MSAEHLTKYILDSNVFISAARTYYSLENFPGVWDFFADQLERRIIVSHRKVLDELLKKDDNLKEWQRSCSSNAFQRKLTKNA